MTQENWYIIKRTEGHCEIKPAAEVQADASQAEPIEEQWGPFASQGEAIARRVGLIRAGKCRPV